MEKRSQNLAPHTDNGFSQLHSKFLIKPTTNPLSKSSHALIFIPPTLNTTFSRSLTLIIRRSLTFFIHPPPTITRDLHSHHPPSPLKSEPHSVIFLAITLQSSNLTFAFKRNLQPFNPKLPPFNLAISKPCRRNRNCHQQPHSIPTTAILQQQAPSFSNLNLRRFETLHPSPSVVHLQPSRASVFHWDFVCI